MPLKQFLVTFDCHDTTHWIIPDLVLTEMLAELLVTAGRVQSEGAIPQVTVCAVETPQGGRQGQLLILKLKEAVTR